MSLDGDVAIFGRRTIEIQYKFSTVRIESANDRKE